MVTTKLNLSMTEPQVRQIYAKQGDTGRVLDIALDQTPEDGTLRILRPDGVEVTSEAVTGGEVSESGETVSFESMTEADVTELTVGIEPVQDLNGYDKPWVGGAGKNKLQVTASSGTSQGITATVNSDGSVTINGTATGTYICTLNNTLTLNGNYILSGCPSGGSAGTYRVDCYWSGQGALIDSGSGVAISPNGNVITTRIVIMQGVTMNNVKFYPMIRLATEADATFAPYSNICPITGHDEVRVTRTGKNLLDTDAFASGRSQYYNVNSDGSINVVANDSTAWNNVPYIPLKAGTYTLSWVTQPSGQLRMKTSDDGYSAESYIGAGNKRYTFTLTDDGGIKLKIGINALYPYTEYLQLELGSTATAYEPYRSNTYTTSLGQTVYGGTLDMVTGQLVVDARYLTVNDFTFMSSGTSAGGLYWVNVPQTYPTGVNDNSDTNVCSHAPYTSSGDVGWGSTTPIYTVNSSGYPARIYVDSTTYADFQTKYATLQAVYKLAEPVEYQLTAQQIKTLVGTNNVWASSGDIVNITFTYGGLLSELPSDATSVVGKCYCDVEQNGVSSMPFTLNVKKNERES